MKRTFGVIAVLGLLGLPLSARAQDGGASDTGSHFDGAAADTFVPDSHLPDTQLADTQVADTHVADTHVADTRVVDARVVDAHTGDAAVGCGNVDYIGECHGTSVHYCLSDQLRVVDCAARYGSSATCGLLDCTTAANSECQGYWCVPIAGASCTGALTACDVSMLQGCLDGVCKASQACHPDTFQPTCTGTVVSGCGYTVNNRDCAAEGSPYSCGATSSGRNGCLGGAGAVCDVAQGVECQAALTCIAGVCGTPQPDAGQSPLDAGPQPDAGTGGGGDGCGCRAASTGSAAFALLGLLGTTLIWRRRFLR